MASASPTGGSSLRRMRTMPPTVPVADGSSSSTISPSGITSRERGGTASGVDGVGLERPPFPLAAAVIAHATAAVKAFFRALALVRVGEWTMCVLLSMAVSPHSLISTLQGRTRLKAYILQDTLRLLQLWFKHGDAAPVRAALEAG